MQAPTTPATITLADGKERVLRFSNGALKTMKEKYGVSILRDGVGKLFHTLDETQLAELLVLGIDHKFKGGQPGITVSDVDDLLDAQNAGMALAQVMLALGNSIVKNVLDSILKGMEMVEQAKKAGVAPMDLKELTETEDTAPKI